ncbi:MAG: hypothetical protein IT267_01195 [Saprospiraceae bacterium]|nr:hypothetical protein [Saprospiraceae bacterium]
MRVVLCYLLFNIFYFINAQERNFFNIVPDNGTVQGQCVFSSIHSYSNSLFIVGDEVFYQDSNGRNKKVRPYYKV